MTALYTAANEVKEIIVNGILTYMSELHVFFVVDGSDSDFALRHIVVIVDIVTQETQS